MLLNSTLLNMIITLLQIRPEAVLETNECVEPCGNNVDNMMYRNEKRGSDVVLVEDHRFHHILIILPLDIKSCCQDHFALFDFAMAPNS